MGKKLTQKQESFAQLYVECGSAPEAYSGSYNCGNMSQKTINRKSFDVVNHPKVVIKIAELRAIHADRHNITVDSITQELEEARQVARNTETPGAMVQASMGKAKLHGIIIDKSKVEVTVNPIEELMRQIEGKVLRPNSG